MFNIKARNVSEALRIGLMYIGKYGELVQSRNGPTLEMPEPVCTMYTVPQERVLFCPDRDANPFFHAFEAIWMLGGRQDVNWLTGYNKQMKKYATDGFLLNGAYGHRWRRHFNYDQLSVAIHRLKNYENDRRTVVSIHDPRVDLKRSNEELDQPCNTHIYFKIRKNRLNMMVCCRSNDMIWGAYGANAVHFSVLQEYMAAKVGVDVGHYTQVSDSFHVYVDVLAKLNNARPSFDPYLHIGADGLHYFPPPMFSDPEHADEDIALFLEKETVFSDTTAALSYFNPYFTNTLEPMREAHRWYKAKAIDKAIEVAQTIEARDWRIASVEWLERRKVKSAAAA